ncbi:hypothetical protein [Massilimicrobiota timonensis]|uniref:hypothetical protein n=1 Tax=Massilimicrobiota timonensis TaxID=1776392 RepID=UPI00101D94DC|nr:hypothetical protein [Massilimicrobiota timonensis]
MKKDFSDIIHMERPQSKHPKMSIYDRSAQFSPFAALTGHDDAIQETARLTEKRRILDKEQIQTLNNQLNFLISHLSNKFTITITYFQDDKLKDGGRYISQTSFISKIDTYQRYLLLDTGEKIYFKDLYRIDGDCFYNDF